MLASLIGEWLYQYGLVLIFLICVIAIVIIIIIMIILKMKQNQDVESYEDYVDRMKEENPDEI